LPCYIVYVVFKLALVDKHGSSNAIAIHRAPLYSVEVISSN
jgi:hypothetical protein